MVQEIHMQIIYTLTTKTSPACSPLSYALDIKGDDVLAEGKGNNGRSIRWQRNQNVSIEM